MTSSVAGDLDRTAVWEQIRAVQEGNCAAFAPVYQRYVGAIRGYVYHRVSDPDLAEDITSETFLRALQRIERVADQGKDLRAWLFTIARNIVIDLGRARWARSTTTVADLESYAEPELDPEAAVIERWTATTVAVCVQRLSPPQRQCLTLRFHWELSVKETAEVMQRHEDAIRALQHRAIRRLATMLAAEKVVDSVRASGQQARAA